MTRVSVGPEGDDEDDRAQDAPLPRHAGGEADHPERQDRARQKQQQDRLRDAGVEPGDDPGLVEAHDVRQRFAERRDEIRAVAALGDRCRDRPHLGVEFQAALDVRLDLVHVVRGDPQWQVLAQQRLHLVGVGLGKVVGLEIGLADGVRLVDDEATAGVEPVGGHAHRDREQERHEPEQRADEDARRALLLARRPRLPPASRPEAELVAAERQDREERR